MWKPGTNLRVLIAIIGCVGAFVFPVWVPLSAIFILAFFWRAWEAMLIGLLVDFLWSPVHSIPWIMLGAIAIVWVLEPIRSEFLSR